MSIVLAAPRSPLEAFRRPAVRRVVLACCFVLLWEFAARALQQPAKLPSPSLVVGAAVPLIESGELLNNALVSLRRVFLGFGLALAVGLPTGLLTGSSRKLGRILYPPLEILRPVPALAMLPIFLAIFGIGEELAVSVVFFAAFFPIVLNTQTGVREVQRIYEEAARTLGALDRQVVREVTLPAALPTIFTGVRLGLQFGWMSIIGAEFIGATSGLGFMILFYEKFLFTDKVIVGMASIGVLGFLLDRVVLLARRLLLPWGVE